MKEFNSLYFIYTGNAYPHKNLERAIAAIVILNKENFIKSKTKEKVKLLIVTSRNVFAERLERTIKKLGATEYVELLGFVQDEKLRTLYENSVGFIYPSLVEGFGLPGLEAMNARTILVASDIPVFREIYGKHAIYFDPKDVISIKAALEKTLLLTKVEAAAMIKGNKEFIKRYSWEKMARETLSVYESI